MGNLNRLQVKTKTIQAPENMTWFFFAGKVFAAAKAEAEVDGKTSILAWLDEDTIVLQEPDEFILLSKRINDPVFFDKVFGAKHEVNDISDVVIFRHESYFRNPAPDWGERLKGPADKIG